MQKARIWSEIYPTLTWDGSHGLRKRFWHVQTPDAHGPLTLWSFEQCLDVLKAFSSNKAYEDATAIYRIRING